MTFSVVSVSGQRQHHADESHGDRQHDKERILEGTELRHQDEVTAEVTDSDNPTPKLAKESRIPSTMPRRSTRRLEGNFCAASSLPILSTALPRSSPEGVT